MQQFAITLTSSGLGEGGLIAVFFFRLESGINLTNHILSVAICPESAVEMEP